MNLGIGFILLVFNLINSTAGRVCFEVDPHADPSLPPIHIHPQGRTGHNHNISVVIPEVEEDEVFTFTISFTIGGKQNRNKTSAAVAAVTSFAAEAGGLFGGLPSVGKVTVNQGVTNTNNAPRLDTEMGTAQAGKAEAVTARTGKNLNTMETNKQASPKQNQTAVPIPVLLQNPVLRTGSENDALSQAESGAQDSSVPTTSKRLEPEPTENPQPNAIHKEEEVNTTQNGQDAQLPVKDTIKGPTIIPVGIVSPFRSAVASSNKPIAQENQKVVSTQDAEPGRNVVPLEKSRENQLVPTTTMSPNGDDDKDEYDHRTGKHRRCNCTAGVFGAVGFGGTEGGESGGMPGAEKLTGNSSALKNMIITSVAVVGVNIVGLAVIGAVMAKKLSGIQKLISKGDEENPKNGDSDQPKEIGTPKPSKKPDGNGDAREPSIFIVDGNESGFGGSQSGLVLDPEPEPSYDPPKIPPPPNIDLADPKVDTGTPPQLSSETSAVKLDENDLQTGPIDTIVEPVEVPVQVDEPKLDDTKPVTEITPALPPVIDPNDLEVPPIIGAPVIPDVPIDTDEPEVKQEKPTVLEPTVPNAVKPEDQEVWPIETWPDLPEVPVITDEPTVTTEIPKPIEVTVPKPVDPKDLENKPMDTTVPEIPPIVPPDPDSDAGDDSDSDENTMPDLGDAMEFVPRHDTFEEHVNQPTDQETKPPEPKNEIQAGPVPEPYPEVAQKPAVAPDLAAVEPIPELEPIINMEPIIDDEITRKPFGFQLPLADTEDRITVEPKTPSEDVIGIEPIVDTDEEITPEPIQPPKDVVTIEPIVEPEDDIQIEPVSDSEDDISITPIDNSPAPPPQDDIKVEPIVEDDSDEGDYDEGEGEDDPDDPAGDSESGKNGRGRRRRGWGHRGRGLGPHRGGHHEGQGPEHGGHREGQGPERGGHRGGHHEGQGPERGGHREGQGPERGGHRGARRGK